MEEDLPAMRLIVGPTGAGKSVLAARVAAELMAPIVVLDRFQVFPDLRTGTARGSHDRDIPARHYLDSRPVAAGELPATDALARLRAILEELRMTDDEVVVEGGSTSMISLLVKDPGFIAAVTSVTVMDACSDRHIRNVAIRARQMLDRSRGESMLDEAERCWALPRERSFVSQICGYDAIAIVCAQLNRSPGQLSSRVIDAQVVPRVVAAHLAYAATQRLVFDQMLPGALVGRLELVDMAS